MSEEIRRAIDPETGLPFEKPTAIERFVGWMLEKYSRKIILKIGVVSAPIIGMIAARLGNTPSASEAIGIGLSAAVLGIVDIIVSYVGKRLGYNHLQSLQKLSEEQEVREQPAIPFTSNSGQSFTRSAMFEALLKQAIPIKKSDEKAFDNFIAKPTSTSDDDQALIELRESMVKPPVAMPTDEEIRQSELKQHGFAVESWDKDNGEPTVTYYETKFQAIAFRDAQRLNHIRANLL